MAPSEELSLSRFRSPRYWPAWGLWLVMRLTVLLPFRLQIRIGKLLGRALGAFDSRERRTAQRNIEICFPELSPEQQRALVRRHFEAIGASFVEMGLAWFAPIERLRKLVRVEGREHFENVVREGKGAVVFMAHFTTMEVCCALFEDLIPGCVFMYNPQKNAFIDAMIRRGRSRFAGEQIPRDNVRALVKALRNRKIVAYLPDQSHVGNQGELLPFFGEPALTNVATSKLARISGAPVLTWFFRRLPDDSGYVATAGQPLQDFPGPDAVEDARRLNALLEARIRLAPEQYLWTYRKFKGRPPPFPDVYRSGSGSGSPAVER
jgi:Kdo2-lipid IVA lauroyltransferase/acyltransferase